MVFLTSLLDSGGKGAEKIVDITTDSKVWGDYAEMVMDDTILD